MRKKLIGLIMAMAMILSFVPSLSMNKVYAAAITATEMKQKLDNLRNTPGFREGDYNSGNVGTAETCMGFAVLISRALFNEDCRNWSVHGDVNNLCVGDHVRYRSIGWDHSITITNISGETVYYVDANSKNDNRVHWNSTTKSNIAEWIARYPLYDGNTRRGGYGYIQTQPNNWIRTLDDTPAPTPTPTPKPVPPTNLSISVNYTTIPVGDAVTFNYSISGAASKNIGIDRNGGRFANIPVSADSGTAVYTFNEKGTYCCIIEGSNDGGSSHSDGVYINVVDRDYPITYNPNGGTGAPSNQTKTFWDTLTLSSDKPSRRGYVFKDWNTKQDGTGTVFNPGAEYKTNEAMTLYAQWTPAVPTVGDIADKTYLGTEITPDLEIKDGSEVLVKDTDYTLTYENNINAGTATVKITYKGDYAESAAVERQFKILQAEPAVKTNPSAKGVILNTSLSTSKITNGVILGVDGITELTGAYSWENGDEIMNQKGKFKKILVYTPDDANYKSIKFELDILVYTNGRPAICRVTFDSKGGSAVPSQTVLSSATEPEQPVKEGYTFDGWYSDSSCTKAYDFSSKVAGNITLYAKWTQIENPVSEDKNNAEKDEKNNEIILTIGQKKATVFGKTKSNDVAPIVRNDRTMLPARFVAESLGADVSWDGVKKEVKITGKDKNNKSIVILIYIDSDTAYVNGKAVKLDSPAFVENDRTYTPIRFISENLGADVDWDGTKMQVIITK